MTGSKDRAAAASRGDSHLLPRHLRRPLLALLPPLVALAAQLSVAGLASHVWFLFFYPAVFLSSWIGGLRAGLVATAISAASVLWFFVPPQHSFIKPLGLYFPIGVFLAMGALFGVFHDRLRRANQRSAGALGESERANQSLREAIKDRRVFAALIENSSDFIGIADPDGKPVYVNPAGRRMVGLSPEHRVENTQIPEYYPPDQRAFASDVIVKSVVEKGHWQGETYFRNWQTEEALPVSDTHFMIRDPETHEILGMGTVTRDISDLRRARDELTRANEEVTHLYEKTKELDELKTQFFASVSHELRTPLALILGPAERSLQAADTPELARRDLEVIARNARTLLVHVNNLLDLAKLEAGRMKPAYAETDVSSLARVVASHFEVLSSEKHIAFAVDGADAVLAQVDPEKVQRVLLNLLSNAFKFTPAGGRIRLTVREATDRVRFEVADSGPGIPADKREAVFERFRQLEEGATRRAGGTGLGLSIAREFVVVHEGSISVSEAPEGGALVVVDLPRAAPAGVVVRPRRMEAAETPDDVRDAVEALRDHRVAVAPAAAAAESARVLVVEDNPEMNRFLCESLASDYRVADAFDGKEGLRKALELRPDLILSDIMMPEMSGAELVHAIRARPELDRTPVVLLTAKADDELRVRLLREGAQDYLMKPFSVEELRSRIGNLLAGKRTLEAEARLASLVEQAPDGIFVADPDGRCAEVNGAGCRMLGYARDEVLGKAIVDLIPPEDVDRFRRAWQQLLEGGVQVAEWRLRCKDGTSLPVEVSAKVLPDGRWQGLVRDVSERKRLERALHDSHADLNRAQVVASVGSWSLDVRLNRLQWSDEAYRIFGIAPGTPMTYEGFLACVHPADRAYVDEKWTAALRGEPYDIEHRVVAGERVKWVREKADLEIDERGSVKGGVGITADITERKRLEDELRLAEAKSSGIVSIAADAMISVDKEQRITMFNEGAERIFGYAKAEVIGAPLDLLIPEWVRAAHRQHVETFAAGEDVGRRMVQRDGLTIFGLRKDGREFPADAAISKLEVDGERVLTVVLRDITEHKRVEKEEKFLAEVGAVLASTLDYEETPCNVANLVVRELADVCIVETLEAEGLLARRLKVAYRDPGKAGVADALQRIELDRRLPHLGSSVLDTRQPLLMSEVTSEYLESSAQSDEHRRALRDLGARSLMALPLLAHGRLVGAMVLVSTTEARRYAPGDLRLAEAVASRAALAVENARLYRISQHAVQARDDVLGIVAHDLRNPLGTILMQTSLLRRRGPEPERRSKKPFEAIERAATRMNRLIEDLLDVTRMEAGRLSIEQSRVRAVQVVSDVVEAQRPLASSSSLELRLDLSPDLPEVWADRDRLLQVFENLIGNALKFTEPGGRIVVGAAPRDGEALFWIADTGSGIAAEDVPHLFDRFWQARKAGRLGAGLGLPIVKGIVEAHGGRVWVESTPGHGSTFFFTIPTAPRAEARQPAEPAPHAH